MDEFKSVKEFSNLYTFENKGDTIVGIYIKNYIHKSKKTGQEYTVHIVDQQLESGLAETQFFGSGQLDALLAKVEEGQRVKIVYEGLSEEEVDTKFGKKHVHQFDVLVAK